VQRLAGESYRAFFLFLFFSLFERHIWLTLSNGWFV
jgi:hypothetical protein